MIYFDNAASGFFKPSASVDKAIYCMKDLSVNAGRSGHFLSDSAERIIYESRVSLSKFFDNGHIGRVIFTSNCTEALNFAIFGTHKTKKTVVTTMTEHNSVLRPLYALERLGFRIKTAGFSASPYITANDILPLIDEDTALVVMNAASNVTGYENEFSLVGKLLSGSHIPLIVDGAQAAGHIKIDMKRDNISALAVAGHKGLMSVQGVGALLFTDNIEISPVMFGGSGNETFDAVPSCYPEKLEAGTHNLPAIASLKEGVDYISDNMEVGAKTLLYFTDILIKGLKAIKKVKVYSSPNPFGICAFSFDCLPSTDAARVYSENFSICVRGGFHCAPLIHKALGTIDDGLIRVSMSAYNTVNEINEFLQATESIVGLCGV